MPFNVQIQQKQDQKFSIFDNHKSALASSRNTPGQQNLIVNLQSNERQTIEKSASANLLEHKQKIKMADSLMSARLSKNKLIDLNNPDLTPVKVLTGRTTTQNSHETPLSDDIAAQTTISKQIQNSQAQVIKTYQEMQEQERRKFQFIPLKKKQLNLPKIMQVLNTEIQIKRQCRTDDNHEIDLSSKELIFNTDATNKSTFDHFVMETIMSLSKQIYDFFKKDTQKLFKRGQQSQFKQYFEQAVGPQAFNKDQIKSELFKYVKGKMTKVAYFKAEKHAVPMTKEIQKILQDNSELLESSILRKMIKYKNKYLQVKQHLLKKEMGPSEKDIEKEQLTPERIKEIKEIIGQKYFRILYSSEGFFSNFLFHYFNVHRHLIFYIKEEIYENSKNLLVMQTLAYLRNILAIRLDSLQMYQEYRQRQEAHSFEENFNKQKHNLEQEVKDTQDQMKKQKQNQSIRNTELQLKLNQVIKERDVAREEMVYLKSQIYSLTDKVNFLNSQMQNAQREIESQNLKSGKGNILIQSDPGISLIDHQLIKVYNDDNLYGMLAGLTTKLDQNWRDLDENRLKTEKIAGDLNQIITKNIENQEDFKYIAQQRAKTKLLERQTTQLMKQNTLLEKQVEVLNKNTGQTKYIIEHQMNYQDLSLTINKGTQTDLRMHELEIQLQKAILDNSNLRLDESGVQLPRQMSNEPQLITKQLSRASKVVKQHSAQNNNQGLELIHQLKNESSEGSQDLEINLDNSAQINRSILVQDVTENNQNRSESSETKSRRSSVMTKNILLQQTANSDQFKLSLGHNQDLDEEEIVSKTPQNYTKKQNQLLRPQQDTRKKQLEPASRITVHAWQNNIDQSQNPVADLSLSSIVGQNKIQSTHDELTESMFQDIEVNQMKILVNNRILQLEPEMREDGNLLIVDRVKLFEVQPEEEKTNKAILSTLMLVAQPKPGTSSNIIIMNPKNIFKVVDELLNKRLMNLFENQSAFRGFQTNEQRNNNMSRYKVVSLEENAFQSKGMFQSTTLLEFAFNEYLFETGLKSLAIKQIRSLAQGLFKLYNQNKEQNFFVRFLIKLFDFEIDGLDEPNKQENIVATANHQEKYEFIGICTNLDQVEEGFNPFEINNQQNLKNLKLNEDQKGVIIWARKVFLIAIDNYLRESKKLQINQSLKYGRQYIEILFEQYNNSQSFINGGIINLNFLFITLRQAFYGQEWDNHCHINPSNVKIEESDLTALSYNTARIDVVVTMFKQSVNYNMARQQLMSILINLEITDVMISNQTDPQFQSHRLIYDFSKNKQTLLEAQFSLWKFLAIVKNCEIDIDNFIICSECAEKEPERVKNGFTKFGHKHIGELFIDLIAFKQMVNYKFLQIEARNIQDHINQINLKRKTEIFTATQLHQIRVMMSKNLGYNCDMRSFPLEHLQRMVREIIDEPYLFRCDKQDQGIFCMNFIQFSKICLNQWRLDMKNQMSILQRIFVENDTNHDGVLDLDEFKILMKQMHDREKAYDAINHQDINVSHELKNVRPPTQNMLKLRTVKLFNQALDLSVEQFLQEKLDAMQVDGNIFEHEQRRKAISEMLHEDEEIVDKLKPMAFTQMIMQNKVGGFSTGALLSDLRFTLIPKLIS